MAQPFIFSLIDKAVFDYNLISDNDRILVGASGGKDSTALIEYFSKRMLRGKKKGNDFEFKALNIHSDFAPELPSCIVSLYKEWKADYESIDVNILERLKEGKKMSCYWCSTQRRTELINYAIKNGYNKIALGHHLDDILETLLMNMTEKGELSTMPPLLKYDNYPLTIIRPLCYIPEEKIIEHAKISGYYGFTCTCNYQENSTRKAARTKLGMLTDGDVNKKMHIFNSLKNIYPSYLP